MSNINKHLPLFGVGPVIVYGQVLMTAITIGLTYVFDVSFASFDILKIPFLVVGIILIIFGFYLDLSAKYKSKLFQNVEENRLITDGVYAYTRNPVYEGRFPQVRKSLLVDRIAETGKASNFPQARKCLHAWGLAENRKTSSFPQVRIDLRACRIAEIDKER